MAQSLVIQPPTIILVDDDRAALASLKFALEIDGYVVLDYANGSAVLRQDNLPAKGCLVIDYNMPNMNGLDLIKLLRQKGVELPAVLITGHATRAIRDGAEAAGVALVEKPFLGDELSDNLRNVLELGS